MYTTKPLSCSKRMNATCSGRTKQCVSCPAKPKDWVNNVGPGYTVYFLNSCCPSLYSPVREAVFDLGGDAMPVPFDNITFVGGFTDTKTTFNITTDTCPFMMIEGNRLVESVTLKNMNVICKSSGKSVVHVENVAVLEMSASNISSTQADSVITVVGGGDFNTATPFSSIDISGSVFDNIEVRASSKVNPANLALANTQGTNIILKNMRETDLVVVQPFQTSATSSPEPFVIPDLSKSPRIFNITQYTNVFGTPYEISYYHTGAGEPDMYEAALRDILTYQLYAFVGMLVLLILTNQDIVYYITVRSKLKTA